MQIDPIALADKVQAPSLGKTAATKVDFSDLLQQEVASADKNIRVADKMTQLYAVGEIDNLHQVMIAISKAQTSFELVAQVRNRLVESAQEMMRMSV
jgi:flagellar hook-basal body complex protein FliE